MEYSKMFVTVKLYYVDLNFSAMDMVKALAIVLKLYWSALELSALVIRGKWRNICTNLHPINQ